MAKRLLSFSLKLLFLNVVAVFIGIFVMFPVASLWKNDVFEWFVSLLFAFLWFLFIWMDSGNLAQKNIQRDKIINRKVQEEAYVPRGDEGRFYATWHGFLAGFLSQLPALILIIVTFFIDGLDWIVKGWYVIFFKSYNAFENALPYLYLAYPILLACVSGVAYLNGPALQRRLETIIERNKAKKARRVQDDLKNKKKSQHRKPANRY